MTEAERSELERKKIEFQLQKEEFEAKKIRLEVEMLEAEIQMPFYKSRTLLRPVVAGISLSALFAAYIHYIFLPEQERLSKKADTAEFVLQKKQAQHDYQLAKLELIQSKIEQESEDSKNQLEAAKISLAEAKKRNEELSTIIKDVKGSNTLDAEKEKLESINTAISKSNKEINAQLADINDKTVKIQSIKSVSSERESVSTGKEGWIYIGYFPKGKWDFKTLDIVDIKPVNGENYIISQNVNIRNQYPALGFLGYDYGDVIGYLEPGQEVKIKDLEIVGRSKVWALVSVSK